MHQTRARNFGVERSPVTVLFCLAQQPNAGQGRLIREVSRSHTTRHGRQDSSGRGISLLQRPLPDNTQHSQETDVHDPGGIRTRNPSK